MSDETSGVPREECEKFIAHIQRTYSGPKPSEIAADGQPRYVVTRTAYPFLEGHAIPTYFKAYTDWEPIDLVWLSIINPDDFIRLHTVTEKYPDLLSRILPRFYSEVRYNEATILPRDQLKADIEQIAHPFARLRPSMDMEPEHPVGPQSSLAVPLRDKSRGV